MDVKLTNEQEKVVKNFLNDVKIKSSKKNIYKILKTSECSKKFKDFNTFQKEIFKITQMNEFEIRDVIIDSMNSTNLNDLTLLKNTCCSFLEYCFQNGITSNENIFNSSGKRLNNSSLTIAMAEKRKDIRCFSRQEILNLCAKSKLLGNYIAPVVMLGIFEGIPTITTLANIKEKDIQFAERTITFETEYQIKTIKFSEEFFQCLKDYRSIEIAKAEKERDEIEENIYNEYFFKLNYNIVKKLKNKNDYTKAVFRKLQYNLSKVVEEKDGKSFSKVLFNSGFLSFLYSIFESRIEIVDAKQFLTSFILSPIIKIDNQDYFDMLKKFTIIDSPRNDGYLRFNSLIFLLNSDYVDVETVKIYFAEDNLQAFE